MRHFLAVLQLRLRVDEVGDFFGQLPVARHTAPHACEVLYYFGTDVGFFVIASLQHPLEVSYQLLLLLLGVATVLRCWYVGAVLYLIPRSLSCAVAEQKPAVVGEDGYVVDTVKAPSWVESARRGKEAVEALKAWSLCLNQSEHSDYARSQL